MARDGAEAERALVERARRGDRAAREHLWRAHRRWVAAIVIAHRPRALDVDDLMQDVAVKYLDKLDTLRDPAALRPWLRRIVINVCRGAARGLHPTLRLADGPEGEDRAAPRSAVAVDDRRRHDLEGRDEASRVLAQALSLPPEYREPLLLRSLQSLSYQQIADIMEVPVTTIETRLARARRMLRAELADVVAAGDATPNGRADEGTLP